MYAIVFHAHQKINRTSRRHLQKLLGDNQFFPSARSIMHFEGKNGPDAAKLKKQHQDQPWHFVDPFNDEDDQLNQLIEQHYNELVSALKQQDLVRSSFEASWLAHALVDGLTPAHHYPYEEELAKLRGGEERHTRKGLVGRGFVKGDTMLESWQRSLKLVGPKGLLTTHALFEAGAWAIMRPLRLYKAMPTAEELANIQSEGVAAVFRATAREIAELQIYHRFIARGWTLTLRRDVRRELAPRMVRMVTLAWYAAAAQAAKEQPAA
ncbi:MAG TPA: hypothetical protein VFI84_00705 [Candidatus Saccharimonadales bacterium]|nr:hypothetical protein [Candidatus Saccharimonadales bacterium]